MRNPPSTCRREGSVGGEVGAAVGDLGQPPRLADALGAAQGADHHHGGLSVKQGVADRAVGAFDRQLVGAVARQGPGQVVQASAGVLEHGAGDLAAADSDDAHECGAGARFHVLIPAARSSGEALSCGAAGAGTLLPVCSPIGVRRRSALSTTVRTSRARTRPRGSHAEPRPRRARRAMTWRHLGCINALSENAETRTADQ